MEELRFNCPSKLSKKFWAICKDRESTLGGELRSLMLREIALTDPKFRKEVGGLEEELSDGESDT